MTEFAKSILLDFWATVAEMSPYLLFGFFVAGILSAFISQSVVERHLGGKGMWPLVKASLFGIPLPLCSCGVIPVTVSLHKHGASKGSAVSFLLSTPQTGADSIFVTLSLLGPVFAIFRPLAALITGIVGGILVNVFGSDTEIKTSEPEKCTDECCRRGGLRQRLTGGLKYGFVTLPRDIGKAIFVGLIIAAFISALVPEGYFAEKLGTGVLPMVIMMFLGIPVYVCATASVPVAAALILKGLSPGAALVFLLTGPATNAVSFVTIWKVFGRATALIYIATVAGSALLCGIMLDYIVGGVGFEITADTGPMLPKTLKYAAAGLLLAILAFAILKPQKSAENH